MDNSIKKYKDIYQKVLRELDVLLHVLHENDIDDDNISLSKNVASEKLSLLHNQLEENITSLENNSEWEVFSIAFYGETNAGKSTLIETLRILLNENTKEIERNHFDQAKKIFKRCETMQNNNSYEISEIKNNIEIVNNKYNKSNQVFLIQIEELEAALISLDLEIAVLNEKINKRITNSVVDFIKNTFGKLEEEKSLELLRYKKQDLISQIANIRRSHDNISNEVDKQLLDYNNRLELLLNDNKKIEHELDLQLNEMKLYSDGKIINAETDFTKTVVNYDFEYDAIKFSLMDLPGIEGNEKIVQDEINYAIEKAHVVFYISKKARTPQNGDNDGGTIGKIKQQLSNQTEVYFIFNKGITNSRQLKKEIEGLSEKDSLREVDENMHSILKDNYQGHISLSAFPAFASICNTVDERLYNSKTKFLSVMNQQELLDMTNLNHFVDWIKNNIVIEVKKKIIKSNLNKIKSTITFSINEVESLIFEFKEFHSSIETNLIYTKKELIENNNILNKNMNNALNRHKNNLKNNVRKSAYEIIEHDVNNDKLSRELKRIIKINTKEFTEEFTKDIDNITNNYKSDLDKLIEKYDKYFEELINLYAHNKSIDYSSFIKIKTRSKLHVGEIIGSVASLIIGIATIILGGETAPFWIVIGTIGSVISIAKEVYGLFDTNYKKSQQRKSVDDNIAKIEKKLEEESSKIINNISIQMDQTSDLIINELNKNNEVLLSTIDIFESSKNKLTSLFKIIKVQEALRNENN